MPSTQTVPTAPDLDRAIALVIDYITALPGHDDAIIHVHTTDFPTDYPYRATVVTEDSPAWLDEDVLETLMVVLEAADIEVDPEILSPYEIGFLAS